MSSESQFAYSLKYNTHFIVKNITTDRKKTIKIFHYPILYGQTRDILQIPGIQEADIRASLLKGEIRHKFLCGDIELISSNIDLLQFSNNQRIWLQNFGFSEGVSIGYDELDGYVQSIIGSGGSGGGGLTPAQHETLRQLIHFIDEGPGNGFASGAFKVIVGQPFPSSITWYTDNTQAKKLVRKSITYDAQMFPTIISWNMYDLDGVTVIHNVTDTVTYINAFESTRTRAIS